MDTFQSLLAKKLSDALARLGLPEAGELTQATDPRFGDYQTNVALVLGKQRGEDPRVLAENIAAHLNVEDLCQRPGVAGAGFINFRLHPAAIEKKALDLLRDERLGVAETGSARRIVIDFGSPNVAKPMHVGHIRSTVLGDALARIAQFLGHNVVRDNHVGDWGTQFGMVIYGWKNLLDRQALRRNPLAEIVRAYKETNERASADPQIREACRQELVKLQAGDKENTEIWNECVAFSMQDFERIYKLLGVRYDLQCGESFYRDRLPEVVDCLLKAKIAEISEGAAVVFFRDDPELSDKPLIIRKRDGGFNYATTDLATIDYRVNNLKTDSIWYVVGAPQKLHFKQIFAIARREGYTTDLRHIIFGSVLGEDRKLMKTRSGENVPLRELLEEACKRARRVVDEKNPDLSDGEKSEIAEKIGIGAVKYADLSQYPNDGLHFFMGQDAFAAREHRAVFTKRVRPDSLNLSQGSCSHGAAGRQRRRATRRDRLQAGGYTACFHRFCRNSARETTLPVCGDCSPSSKRVSAKYSGKLSIRAGEQFPCLLRGLPRLEIRGTVARFASGVVRAYSASFEVWSGSFGD